MEEEEELDLYYSFKVVFNDQVIQINYDSSFKEFKTQTIECLIKEVLNKIGPKPLEKEPKDYILYCPCGNQLNQNELIYKAKCNHLIKEDFEKEKKHEDKYVLCEKYEIEYEKEELTNDEIDKILKKALNKTNSKNINKNNSHRPKKKILSISESLKNKIKEYKIKEERGKKIIENNYSLHYKEEYYKELIEMGIDKNKAKASLRYAKNDKEEAALIGTEEEFYWDNKDYLFYDNNDVLTKENFNSLVYNEIKKEYPFLNKEEIISNFNDIINLAVKKDIIEEDDNNDKNEISNYEEDDDDDEENDS